MRVAWSVMVTGEISAVGGDVATEGLPRMGKYTMGTAR